MKFIADFHIHSRFSVATSPKLTPEILDRWALIKGIRVLGTGDFTHPGWFEELEAKLVPAEEGLFTLEEKARRDAGRDPYVMGLPVPAAEGDEDRRTRFVLSAEISTIYSADGRVRKVHHVLLAPGFEEVGRIRARLAKIGNLAADGRPILGLDSRDLLEIVLEASEDCVLVPAHVWTPWFSALGAKSGFDSIAEAYRDLADRIFAVETGLSSDPPMNWLCSRLDPYAIISNSDAHSPENLGREANVFDCELSYPAVVSALKSAAKDGTAGDGGFPGRGFLGTYEFFPEEGKYHFDGHRKCGVKFAPVETAAHGGICPKCGKPLTEGVARRVAELADRTDPLERPGRRDFRSLIPLKEILAELLGTGPSSKTVAARYGAIVRKGGSELAILAELPLEEVAGAGGRGLAEAVGRMRERRVYVDEGSDGEYGTIRVFAPGEKPCSSAEDGFLLEERAAAMPPARALLDFEPGPRSRGSGAGKADQSAEDESNAPDRPSFDADQLEAVEHGGAPLLVLAGPGTGKTRVLAGRIARLVEKGVPPENFLAITFTNKAAEEMRSRLDAALGPEKAGLVTVRTFHAFALDILRSHRERLGKNADFLLIGGEDRLRVIRDLLVPRLRAEGRLPEGTAVSSLAKMLSAFKQGISTADDGFVCELAGMYGDELLRLDAFDLDDLVPAAADLLEQEGGILESYRNRFTRVLVDEYQDVNATQCRLLRLLSPQGENLTAVGDPNQAIYGFRGADPSHIRRFGEDYPSAETVVLGTSYRCPEAVLAGAEAVVGSTTRPKGGSKGRKIGIARFSSDAAEAEFIARTIEGLSGGLRFFSMDSGMASGQEAGIGLGGVAVLVRSSRQMEPLEKAFRDHAVPYVRAGESSRLAEGPAARILSFAAYALRPENPFLRAVAEEVFPGFAAELPPGALAALSAADGARSFVAGLVGLLRPRLGVDADAVLKTILDRTGRLDPAGFLRAAALGTAQDDLSYRTEAVALSTIHAAKGLEFDCVFITGCEDGLVPCSLFEDRPCDRDEERRILYVGMTRAKKLLILTSARRRSMYGREHRLAESPFLSDLDEFVSERIETGERPRNPQLDLF